MHITDYERYCTISIFLCVTKFVKMEVKYVNFISLSLQSFMKKSENLITI